MATVPLARAAKTRPLTWLKNLMYDIKNIAEMQNQNCQYSDSFFFFPSLFQVK